MNSYWKFFKNLKPWLLTYFLPISHFLLKVDSRGKEFQLIRILVIWFLNWFSKLKSGESYLPEFEIVSYYSFSLMPMCSSMLVCIRN